MGTSTDGLLFWGITLDEDERPWLSEDHEEDEDFDPEDMIARHLGLEEPGEYPLPNKEAWTEYWARKNEALKTFQVELDSHCSGEYPIYFITLKQHHYRAARGYPKEIDPAKLVVTPGEIERLKEGCRIFNIPWVEPKWFLASKGN
jgi:hypothetical protein